MTTPSTQPTDRPLGIASNLAGALAYLLGPITGVFFLVTAGQDRFIRFHAMQSLVVSAALFAANLLLMVLDSVLAFVPVLGWAVGFALTIGLGIVAFVLWLVLMYRAYHGSEWQVPVLGAYARRYSLRSL